MDLILFFRKLPKWEFPAKSKRKENETALFSPILIKGMK